MTSSSYGIGNHGFEPARFLSAGFREDHFQWFIGQSNLSGSTVKSTSPSREVFWYGIEAYLGLHRRQFILTKGDNNDGDDVALYPPGQLMVGREEVVGLVKGYLPYVGWLSIGLQESPLVTGALVGGLLLLAAS